MYKKLNQNVYVRPDRRQLYQNFWNVLVSGPKGKLSQISRIFFIEVEIIFVATLRANKTSINTSKCSSLVLFRLIDTRHVLVKLKIDTGLVNDQFPKIQTLTLTLKSEPESMNYKPEPIKMASFYTKTVLSSV